MSLTFAARTRTPGSPHLRMPANAPEPDLLELGDCNANGCDLLIVLGLAPEPMGEVPIERFRALLAAALRRHLGHRSPAIPPKTVPGGGMAVVFLGRPEGYVERRLGELAQRVQRGRALGATHVVWS